MAIPCPGHALLVAEELEKIEGVGGVRFKQPDLFEINYQSDQDLLPQILEAEIFKSFPATVI